MSASPDTDAIWGVVVDLNRAWFEGRSQDLAPFFHPSVVMFAPTGERLLEGRDAMVRSFVDYTAAVRTHAFTERDGPDVRVCGATAVVSYAFDVEYEFESRRHVESGREVLTLSRDDGEWHIVMRMQIPGGDADAATD